MSWLIKIAVFLSVFNSGKCEESPRVVGGERCSIYNNSFMVLIVSYKKTRDFGTLVTNDFVLTSCWGILIEMSGEDPNNPSFLKVVAGVEDGAAMASRFTSEVEQIHYHPECGRVKEQENYYNDIALLKLNRPLPLSERVGFVRLPLKKEKNFYRSCKVPQIIGFGKLPYAYLLRCAKMNVVQDCREEYKKKIRPNAPYNIAEHLVCVESNKSYPCHDVGSPLMCGNVQYGIYVQVHCLPEETTRLYTRVDHFLDWINNVINSPPFMAKKNKTISAGTTLKINLFMYLLLCIIMLINQL